jgi:tRNA threonylcarbamoyl adenosine modification protein YeaZ
MTSHESFSQDGNHQGSWSLLVDCSSRTGSLIALTEEGHILESVRWGKEKRHSHILSKSFFELSKKYKSKELSKIYFIQGPGSFTGLRVAAAFIKALSYSLSSIPIICFSAFYATALKLITEKKVKNDFCVAIPSIGDKFFYSRFSLDDHFWYEKINHDGAQTLVDLPDISYFGSDDRFKIEDPKINFVPLSVEDLASTVRSHSKIQPYRIESTHLDLYPLYLRKSEAEEKLVYDKAKLQ